MPRLSILIPCLGGAAEFDGTLVSVLQNRPADCEVLVLHSEPYADPYGLGHEVRFIRAPAEHLIDLINAAIHEARGEILHIIGCGLEVVEGWTTPALAHFADAEVAALSPLVLDHTAKTVVSAGVRYTMGGARKVVADRRLLHPGTGRLRAKILGPTLTAGFYRRDVLAALDGYDATLGDSLADIDMALAIQALGRLHICEPASRLIQTTDPWASIPARGFAHGRAAARLFWRYIKSRGLASSLAFRPLAVTADLIRQRSLLAASTSLLGRAVASLEFGAAQRFERRLATANERLAELATLRATIRLPQSRSKSDSQSAARRAA